MPTYDNEANLKTNQVKKGLRSWKKKRPCKNKFRKVQHTAAKRVCTRKRFNTRQQNVCAPEKGSTHGNKTCVPQRICMTNQNNYTKSAVTHTYIHRVGQNRIRIYTAYIYTPYIYGRIFVEATVSVSV